MPLPKALVMPHENAAMGMAYGYYLATGRAQAVMAHTNVGLANCAIGAINAATEHVPMLLMSGRTPTLEQGHLGARTVPIGWGQEMRDQTALVRESCKWDYELRFPEQAEESVDRAFAIANSTPKGPVYLSLPREVLCEPVERDAGRDTPSMAPALSAPPAATLAEAADLLANAQNPLIIAQRGAGSAEGFAALARMAERWGMPLVHYWAIQIAIPTNHAMARWVRSGTVPGSGRRHPGHRQSGALVACHPRPASRLQGHPARPGPALQPHAGAQLPGRSLPGRRDRPGSRRTRRGHGSPVRFRHP